MLINACLYKYEREKKTKRRFDEHEIFRNEENIIIWKEKTIEHKSGTSIG